jgi:hypothetical protein
MVPQSLGSSPLVAYRLALGTDNRIRAFLTSLLNLEITVPPEVPSDSFQWATKSDQHIAERFCLRFSEFMPNPTACPCVPGFNVMMNVTQLWFHRGILREAWGLSTQLDRELFLLANLHTYMSVAREAHGDPAESCCPKPGEWWPTGLVLYQDALSVSDKMRICSNSAVSRPASSRQQIPSCPRPYFVADRSNQTCCGLHECIKAVQALAGRRWWSRAGGGSDQRKARARSSSVL